MTSMALPNGFCFTTCVVCTNDIVTPIEALPVVGYYLVSLCPKCCEVKKQMQAARYDAAKTCGMTKLEVLDLSK